jgi:lysyl-tRNA synthetase class 1
VVAGGLRTLSDARATAPAGARAEDLQTLLYDVGRTIPRYQDLNAKGATPEKPGVSNAWFGAIYQVLLGEERGPRFGSFIELYGVENTRALIEKALKGELVKAAA